MLLLCGRLLLSHAVSLGYDGGGEGRRRILPFRPVAPEQVSRASSMRMELSRISFSERRRQAMDAPVMPLPMMRVVTWAGRAGVLRWEESGEGGMCQCEGRGEG